MKVKYITDYNFIYQYIKLSDCCGKEALKPNLFDSIKSKIEGNKYTYYIKVTSSFYVGLSFEIKEDIIINEKKKLEMVSEVIVEFYKSMIKYYQSKIVELKVYELYEKYNKDEFIKLQNLIRYITHFLTKLYYEYPLNEDRKTSGDVNELMEQYHIREQINELKDKLMLLREISENQMTKKEEQKREKWNIRFAIIGIVIALIDIICNFL